jgi:hypothetical protein
MAETTMIHLIGRDEAVSVSMTVEELLAALETDRPLAQLDTGDGTSLFVNPAHVVSAQSFEPASRGALFGA